MKSQHNPNPISPDSALASQVNADRAKRVPWEVAPAWAARYRVREQFGEVVAQWESEDGLTREELVPAFSIVRGEDVSFRVADHVRR